MVWKLSNAAGTTSYSCLGNSIIRNKLNELDSAEVTCPGTFTPDTVVKIMDGATEIFRGYVKESRQEANGKLYKLTLVESAQDLKYAIIEYSGSRSFIRSSQTVRQLADMMLTGTGWSAQTTDATSVTSIGFYNTTVSSGMYKLIKDMQGKYIWYTDDGTNKYVYWGTYRTDRTGSPITTIISMQAETDSMDRNITKITVYGENSTIYGSYGTGTKEKLYKYALAKTSAECTDVATKLLADIGSNKNRYKVTLPKTNTYFAGDKVQINSVDYVIFDVTRTMSNTVIGIGAPEISYAETLGSNLTTIDGSIKTPVDASWSGGVQNVAAASAAYTDFSFDINDVALVSDAYLDCVIGNFVKSANVASETELLSDISQVVSSNSYTTTSYFSGATYLPSSSGFSSSLTNGHQFAFASINGDFRSNSGAYGFTMYCEYSIDGSTWYDSGVNYYTTLASDGGTCPCTFTYLLAGNTSSTYYVRFKIVPDSSNTIKIFSYSGMFCQRVTRHKHSVTTTYDRTTTGTPPTKLYAYINGIYKGELTPGTPISINTNLISGKNVIRFQTANVAGNQCSVNPTITYKTLGNT